MSAPKAPIEQIEGAPARTVQYAGQAVEILRAPATLTQFEGNGVRVTKAGDGTYVSAVDPRGLPPSGEAAGKLIGLLKAAIAP